MRSKITDCFKVLSLDFVITCLIVLDDICVLTCWQLDEIFGNYMLLTYLFVIHDKLYVGIVHKVFITYEIWN